MTAVRLGLLAAAPMYYHAPVYRRVAADPRIDFEAIFLSRGGIEPHDAGYGTPITWDVDPLAGYESRFLRRASRNPIAGRFVALRDFDVVPLVRSRAYDFLWIHGYNFLTHTLAAGTQRACGRPVAYREEQTLIHPRPLLRTIRKEISLRLLFRGTAALYIGTENKRWFEHYGVPPERLFFTPYVVDNEALRAAAEELAPARGELRAALGVRDPDVPIILTVCRLLPWKQPEFLLEAFRRVRMQHRCALVIVGSGPLENELRARVERDQIPDVHLTGFVNQSRIARVYAAADVFALTSRLNETWGLVVNEAMNFELPVVVSDRVGCGTDLVRDGLNGYRINAFDPDDAASALERLVADADLRRRFGSASREIISTWSPEVAAEGVLSAVAAGVGPGRWEAASAGAG